MAVTVTLSDGSQFHVNGRSEVVIEWFARNAIQLSRFQKVKIEVNCAGEDTEVKTMLAELSEKLPRPKA